MTGRVKDMKAIFSEAIEKATSDDLTTYLDEVCGSDGRLRSEIESLVTAHRQAGAFLQGLLENESPLQVAMSEGPGTVIGRYKLLEKIGEGGMAVVYMAEQTEPIRRKVALKIIKLGMDTRQVIARFEAERQALAVMDHPNIARVFDAGATETGRPYFVMELVTGVSITEYCDANHLSTQGRLALFVQVCGAIQHAHQKGIIHRDIKPSNVMVTMHDGRSIPKVIDFGIAKATNQRLTEKTLFTRYAQIIGTPAYMSPEQAEWSDVDVDTRSDIYSLGVLLYELLTGTTPFSERQLREAGYAEMQRVIREEEPTKPSTKLSTLGDTLTDVARRRSCSPDLLRKTLRGDLDWIVMKALEKERTRRYDGAGALLVDIQRHLNCEPVSAGPPGPWYQTRKFVQRHGALVGAITAIVAAVSIGLIASMVMYFRAERARAETQAVTDFLASDVLAAVYPENAKGQEVTVRYLLETASVNLEKRFGGEVLAEARVRTTVGLTYQKMGDCTAAEPHLERALEIRRRHLGDNHPATLGSLDQLAWLYWCQGRSDKAQPILQKAFEGRRRVLGTEHPDTLESMTHLAWLQQGAWKTTLADEAYEIACRVLGEEHPTALGAAAALAMKRVVRFQLRQAEMLAPRAYVISRRVLGDGHETTLVLMNALSWLYGRQQRFEVALPMAEKARQTAQQILGSTHMVTLHACANLGWLYTAQGRVEEADALLTQSLDLARQHLGPDHMITVCCALKLGILYRAQGRYDEHDPLLTDLLETCRKCFGEDAVITGFARFGLDVRRKQLTALLSEQQAGGDSEGAAGTSARLEQICLVLSPDSQP